MIMIVAVSVSTLLLARVGPKILVTLGMLLAAVGMVFFTQISLTTSYAWPILPGLLVMGAGLGFIFATAINSSTIGVAATDAGVASALVNACQQVGGALGTALLSTIAASAATSFGSSHAAGATTTAARAALTASSAVHGYTTAFWVSAAIFLVGAVISAALYQRGVKVTEESMVKPSSPPEHGRSPLSAGSAALRSRTLRPSATLRLQGSAFGRADGPAQSQRPIGNSMFACAAAMRAIGTR
jgi:MFS family permease